MKAISLLPGTTNLDLKEVPEPSLERDDDIKVRILQVGICGTDREEANGGRADAPPGKAELIIGHEMFGQVVQTGPGVEAVRKGDFGVFTVRRGCGSCQACRAGRSDMCCTGRYTERGIKGADGFQAEFVVDREMYFVKVPEKISAVGVLTEPMSVAAKAIDEAVLIQQARLRAFEDTKNWFKGKKALIAGIGPIGLMAALALRLRGAEVTGMDIVDEDTLRPQILRTIGGKYVDGRVTGARDLDDMLGQIDFVFEATGIARLQIQLIDTLGMNAIYVATGIPAGSRPLTVEGGELMRQLVLKNQVLVGSVNAGIEHYRTAVRYLEDAFEKWPEALGRIITRHVPASRFREALRRSSADEIKTVVEWG